MSYNFMNNSSRNTPEYRKWREKIIKRDKNICKLCGIRTDEIHVHHLISFNRSEKFATDISNGMSLCVNCHSLIHKKKFKKDDD